MNRRQTSNLARYSKSHSDRHLQAATLSLAQLIKKPFTTIMISVVIAIALALPTGLYIVLENAKPLSDHLDGSASILLYLNKDISDQQARTLGQQIEGRSEIDLVKYVSPEEGLSDFEAQTSMGDLLMTLPENPIPGLLAVTPKADWHDPESLNILFENLALLPEVETAQIDLEWLNKLSAVIDIAQRFVYALSILFGLGVIFVIGGMIHLVTQSHKDEIFVFQLVGASKAFIRRPFLYTGMWYGLFGSLLASILVLIFFYWISIPSKLLGQFYEGILLIQTLSAENMLVLLGIGITLGICASWIVMHKYLSRDLV